MKHEYSGARVLAGALSGFLAVLVVGAGFGSSAVHAQEKDSKLESRIERLGKDLTPLGAERAGNEDGTIPDWTGGLGSPPEGYARGIEHFDPFPDDKILFTINKDSSAQYAERLTPGQLALLDKVPNFRMPVYVSRRSCYNDQEVYDAIAQNASSARLIDDGNSVAGARLSIPFPFPKNGLEAIWNHQLRMNGFRLLGASALATVNASGSYSLVRSKIEMINRYANYEAPPLDELPDGVRSLAILETVEPPANAGQVVLSLTPVNRKRDPRQLWVYAPGERRVRRVPDVGHDTPAADMGGMITDDQLDSFNGSPDRYDWELRGKKEIYIGYNSYRIHSHDLKYSEMLIPGTVNPDFMRYELHRSWVVDAKLKPGQDHIYGRRTFYLDEDSWTVALADSYDRDGDLWRVELSGLMNWYALPTCMDTITIVHDLRSGRYVSLNMDNEEAIVDWYPEDITEDQFTASQIRRRGTR